MLKAILVRTQEEKERFRESLYHLREDIQAVRMLLEIWTQRVILRKSQLEMKGSSQGVHLTLRLKFLNVGLYTVCFLIWNS